MSKTKARRRISAEEAEEAEEGAFFRDQLP
jgi:hypothetical protein